MTERREHSREAVIEAPKTIHFEEGRSEADAADGLLEAAAKQQDRIVGVYLAEVEMGPDHRPQPVHFREAFRATGPSNYAHGKQAEG